MVETGILKIIIGGMQTAIGIAQQGKGPIDNRCNAVQYRGLPCSGHNGRVVYCADLYICTGVRSVVIGDLYFVFSIKGDRSPLHIHVTLNGSMLPRRGCAG